MKITVDTNVLARAAVQDDEHQARQAAKILRKATLVAIPVPVLWVTDLRGHLFTHPAKAGPVVVPHPRKDFGTGLIRAILKQAQLTDV